MASITVSGIVACKEGTEPVTIRTFGNGNQAATFSVCDLEYVYTKEGEERQGQFYRVEVLGKPAEFALDRLRRGDRVTVRGQLVQRVYQDKLYVDVKAGSVTYLEKPRNRPDSSSGSASDEDIPF